MNNDNLAIQMFTHEEGYAELWNTLTVNLDEKCKKNCAYIDTNNNGEDILSWIEENKLAKPTGRIGFSGFCSYPEYEFNDKVLMTIDPEGYQEYIKKFK